MRTGSPWECTQGGVTSGHVVGELGAAGYVIRESNIHETDGGTYAGELFDALTLQELLTSTHTRCRLTPSLYPLPRTDRRFLAISPIDIWGRSALLRHFFFLVIFLQLSELHQT